MEKDVLSISQFHPNSLKVLRGINSSLYNKELIDDAIDFYAKADNPDLLEECYMILIDWHMEKTDFETISKIMNDYEASYEPSAKYKEKKFKVLMHHEHLTEALSLFDELKPSEILRINKMEILCMLGRIEEMEAYYASIKKSKEVQAAYLSCKKDWKGLNELYKEWSKSDDFATDNHIMAYSYSLLQVKDYDGVERLLKPYYDNPLLTNGVIIVNFLFARKMNGKNVDQRIREKIIDNKFIEPSEFELAGAYAVLKDRTKTLDNIKKILKKQPSAKYNIKEWPILYFLQNDNKFIELLKPGDNR